MISAFNGSVKVNSGRREMKVLSLDAPYEVNDGDSSNVQFGYVVGRGLKTAYRAICDAASSAWNFVTCFFIIK